MKTSMKLARFVSHLLFPRHTNNHKAKIIHNSSLFVIAFLVALSQLGLHLIKPPEGTVLGYASSISIAEVVEYTNQKRAEAGVPPLKLNNELSRGAQAKGENMLQLGYWAHIAPDGTTPWKFFGEVNYKYRYAGENLARDFSNAASAVNAWMASPTHKENLLSSKYKEIGIGVVEGNLAGVDTTIIVQFFGTTMADTIPTQPVAKAASTKVTNTPLPSQTPEPKLLETPNSLAIVTAPSPTPANRVLVSPFITTRNISAVVVMILMLAFVIDIIIISRRRIVRLSGRSLAHVAFLGMILTIVMIVQAGNII